jgi:putative Mg2+ transporter-C (MgtC) family protein
MPTALTWHAIALRLLLTVISAGAIGLNRDERGHSAGLRTNLLVGLAACVAMIQANLLINSNGRSVDSFAVMDIMRLPLGILSGIGFIGAGAIIKRGDMVAGVTTAATLWFVTVMGLCYGGGQIALGLTSFALAILILSLFKKIETAFQQQHSAMLKLTVQASGASQEEIASLLTHAGFSLTEPFLCYESSPDQTRVFGWKLQWKGKHGEVNPPRAVQDLAARADIQKIELTR